MSSPQPPASASQQGLSLLQVVQSVAWSFFGVQSHHNRLRDFSLGRPMQFIVVGFALTGVVVGLFIAAAQLALRFL